MRFALHEHLTTLLMQSGIAAKSHTGEPPCLNILVTQWTTTAKLAKEAGLRLVAVWATQEDEAFAVHAAFAHPDHGYALAKTMLDTTNNNFPSITPHYVAAARMERVIHDLFGLVPAGLPDTRPWIKHEHWPQKTFPLRKAFSADTQIARIEGHYPFIEAEGDGVYEIPVGPVHAGIIEPGHFRFQCHGETVYHLEISLGYQHRGIEARLPGGPDVRTIHYMETLAGDTTVGHSAAYSQAVESLAGTAPSMAAHAARGAALELERMANHIGCLGAVAGDVAFLPVKNYCGRIRGDVLNMTALLCGNRFGRGLVRPGGLGYPVDRELGSRVLERLDAVERDLEASLSLMFDAPSVLGRLEGIGPVTARTASTIGMVGVAARASGLPRDVRSQFPYGIYRYSTLPMCTWSTGDCFARAWVRWMEVQRSIHFLRDNLVYPALAASAPGTPVPRPDRITVSLLEGTRGEICHVAATDEKGRFAFYKVVDPSFHNWFGLALALRGQQISDFPLCNKSFDLSYCGHDL